MTEHRPSRVQRRLALLPAAGLSLSLGLLTCTTEAPMPQAAPVPAPVQPSQPAAPSSRLKFDVGAMPTEAPEVDPATVTELTERLADAEAVGSSLRSPQTVRAFYAQRGHRPAWISGRQITAKGVDALRGLGELSAHGLEPARYGTDALAPTGPEPADPVGFELLLTDAWLTAATHLGKGRVDRKTRRTTWTADGRADALIEVLEAALAEGGSPREAMLAQAPPFFQYSGLVQLHRARRGEPEPATDEAKAERERLLGQIPVDLERMRWLSGEGKRHLWLDVSSRRLSLVEGDKSEHTTEVAVSKRCGKLETSSTTVTEVVINPSHAEHGIYALRVADGGWVLHGGTEGQPFPEDGKARAGCIRLNAPHPLITELLRRDPGFARVASEVPEVDAIAASPERVVTLDEPVPLHIVRPSVILEQQQGPQVHEDALARDASLRAALAGGPEPVRRVPARAVPSAEAPP